MVCDAHARQLISVLLRDDAACDQLLISTIRTRSQGASHRFVPLTVDRDSANCGYEKAVPMVSVDVADNHRSTAPIRRSAHPGHSGFARSDGLAVLARKPRHDEVLSARTDLLPRYSHPDPGREPVRNLQASIRSVHSRDTASLTTLVIQPTNVASASISAESFSPIFSSAGVQRGIWNKYE